MIFSGLEVVKDIIGVPCPHFDGKGVVEKYLDEIGVPNTSVRYAFYFDNFGSFFSTRSKLTVPTFSPSPWMGQWMGWLLLTQVPW